MAPNVFHIGVKERVSVSVFDAAQPVTVKLYLQDYPHRRKTFSQVQGIVRKGDSRYLKKKKDFLGNKLKCLICLSFSFSFYRKQHFSYSEGKSVFYSTIP